MEEKNKKGFLSKLNFNAKLKTKVIIVFICALLIAFILPLAWYVITEGIGSALKGIVSSFEDMSKLLFVTDEGSIEISDEDVDNFIKEMVKEDISVEQLGIPKSKQREYIKKFMMAYLVTQTPNAHVENEQNGAIWLQRHNAREDEIVDMIYVKELTTESGTDKYSINEDGNIIYIGVNGEICTIESSKYEKYRIPMMFFLELCITTQNPNYVRALAQEVIDNTKIVIVLEESEYITTTTIVNVQEIYDQAGNMIRQVSNETTETTVTKSVVPIVTEVDELLYSRTQTYNRKENVGDSSTRTEIIREENPREYQIITSQTTSYTFERGVEKDLEVKYKQDDPFPKLTKTEYVMPNNGAKISAYDSIKSGGEVMFENMDKHMEDEELIQVLKYVLYKMTGIDYGVKNLDGSLFDLNNFNKSSASTSSTILGLLVEFVRFFEGETRKVIDENGVECYVAEPDSILGASVPTIGHGITNNEINMAYFPPEYQGWTVGWTIPVEIVNKVEEDILRERHLKVIQENYPYLTPYQQIALASMHYNLGSTGGFEEAYQKYWKAGMDKYGEECKINANSYVRQLEAAPVDGYGHLKNAIESEVNCKLFSNFWSIYTHAGGSDYPGLYKRRFIEWLVFQYGYFYNTDSYYVESHSEVVEGDGYDYVYTKASGSFKEYKQYKGSYANNRTCFGGTIYSEGCMVTAMAIILSGYGVNETPGTINAGYNGMAYSYLQQKCRDNNIKYSNVTMSITAANRQAAIKTIRDSLNKGGIVYFDVDSTSIFTNSTHYMAILDIRDNNEIYISDPARESAWYSIDVLNQGLTGFMVVGF